MNKNLRKKKELSKFIWDRVVHVIINNLLKNEWNPWDIVIMKFILA